MRDRMERHHVLFNRRAWSSANELAALRGDPQLIIPLEHDVHRELHDNVSHVPPLSLHVAKASLYLFDHYHSTNNPLRSVEQLQRSIERAIKHPKADYLERQVGKLAVHSLDLQKPYIATSPGRVYPTSRRHNSKSA